MGETGFDACLDKHTDDGALNAIRPGSLVSITGVYSYQAGPPPSFRLLLRSPRAIVLVAAAPWWTLRHTLVMVTMLTLAAGVGGVWLKPMARSKRQQYHVAHMAR